MNPINPCNQTLIGRLRSINGETVYHIKSVNCSKPVFIRIAQVPIEYILY